MAIYAISDLHLSLGDSNKPMNIFGDKWENYEMKIKNDWISKIKPDDSVILSGDFSWATYLEESKKDFEFLNSLPGKKYLLKGNHDYWWTTVKKMNEFLKQNHFENIYFIYNNTYDLGEYMLCGTRYWGYEEELEDNEKIFKREIMRAKMSLNMAKSIEPNKPIIFTTHYPPDSKIIDALQEYNIKIWIYGHIHTNYEDNIVQINNIDTYLTSCDYLNFEIKKI